VTPKLSQLADALTRITSSPEPASIDPPTEPKPEPEEVAPTPVLDEATRRAREYCKRMMPHLIFADELTPKQYRRKLWENQMAMRTPPRPSWMGPHGHFGRR
jgi:hypothetical protein